MLEVIIALFAFAAGFSIGRDTLARENRRLRRQRDNLIDFRAPAGYRPPHAENHIADGDPR